MKMLKRAALFAVPIGLLPAILGFLAGTKNQNLWLIFVATVLFSAACHLIGQSFAARDHKRKEKLDVWLAFLTSAWFAIYAFDAIILGAILGYLNLRANLLGVILADLLASFLVFCGYLNLMYSIRSSTSEDDENL